jgi:RNA recognition motif-containing protein
MQSRRVYVGNLSWDVAWQDLKDHACARLAVLPRQVIMELNGRSKGAALWVATDEAAQEAIKTLTDTRSSTA